MKNIIVFILAATALITGLTLAYLKDKDPEQNISIGGEFSLQDQDGNVFTQQNLQGKYSLVFFGFTNCPDICPATLTVISEVMDGLKEAGKNLNPVFISVDSTSDTPKSMKLYLSNFHPAIIGLSGTHEQIKQVTAAYKVYYAKVAQPNASNGYTMDHSAFVYLMDKNGKYVAHFNHDDSADKITKFLKPKLEQ